MNVQDAKDLHITEGDVRTIHDSSGKQLWGRLNYNTKYAGDIVQQTYTGKNLFNKNLTPYSLTTSTTVEVLETGIKVQQSVDSTANLYATYVLGDFSSFAGESVTLSCDIYTSGQNNARLALGYCKADGSSRTTKVTIFASSGQVTLELSASELAERPYLYIYAYVNSGQASAQANDYVEYTNLQLEFGSTATSYEPYVGGIPAPNPDYPQPINVVTGTQTVTITGGTVSNNFTLNLGALELCKIGSYQDYIYKSGDDWYLHKEIDSVTISCNIAAIIDATGSSSTSGASYAGAFTIQKSNWDAAGGNYDSTIANAILSYNIGQYKSQTINANNASNTMDDGTFCQRTGTNDRIYFRLSTYKGKTGNDVKALLLSNGGGANFYYYLSAPTNTQITDTTLISQLNAAHEWLTRYGYTATVSGNLPLIINQTSLS